MGKVRALSELKEQFFSNFYKIFNSENGILLGGFLALFGFFMSISILKKWFLFGSIAQERHFVA